MIHNWGQTSCAHRRREAEELAREAHDGGIAVNGVHARRWDACSPQCRQRAAANAQTHRPLPL